MLRTPSELPSFWQPSARAFCLFLAGLLLAVPCPGQTTKVGVDLRVELMSIIFRLAGNPEYSEAKVPAYTQSIEAHFSSVRNHEAVRLARELRQTDGVTNDAVMSLAIHVKDAFSLKERVDFDSPGLALARSWKVPEARKFLDAARRFVIDSRFRDFARSQQPLYDLTDARLRALVEKRASLSWFDRFFGVTPGAPFVIAPGLGNGGGSYGVRFVSKKGPLEIWAIPGVNDVDAEGLPRFDEQMLPTLVHEFCHSYVNPIVDRYATKLDRSGPRIYDPVKDAMNRQAYVGWKTMFYESLVRVSTARYLLAYGGEKAALPIIRDELAHSFLWTADLFDLLGEYERSRDRYPTFDSFMPRIVDYFDGLAPHIDDMIRRYDE